MPSLPRGPRKYKVFICHRYGDDELYGKLRAKLNKAKNFTWENLSIQTENPLTLRTERGLKTAITRKIIKADVLLVFAHSSGKWIDHEVDTASKRDVPIIAILDPVRLNEPRKRARSSSVGQRSVAEVSLDSPADIIGAIRKHVHRQVPLPQPSTSTQVINTPRDIARRAGARRDQRGFMARLGKFLFGQSSADRQDDHID